MAVPTQRVPWKTRTRFGVGGLFVLLALAACAPGFLGNSGVSPARFPEPARDALTFWGHATCYLDVEGFGIVTDPVFGRSYSPFHARKIPAPPEADIDRTRVILISHAHRDHLDPGTLRRFPQGTLVICPEPSARYLDGLGLRVRVLHPWDEVAIPGGRIVAVPAYHPGGRNSLAAAADGRALGYVIHALGHAVYYSGDTEYFEGLFDIRRTQKPDVAVLNVNAHLHGDDALLAVAALGYPRVLVGHHGAYRGSNSRHAAGWRRGLHRLLEGAVWMEVGKTYALEDTLQVQWAREAAP